MADDRDRDDEDEVQLPPAFLKFQAQLKTDRKKLLREEAFGKNPDQLRGFIAQFLYPRLNEFVHLMGLGLYDTYGLAVSSENQLQRMRAVYGKALKKLGADVEDEDGELPGLSPEILDEFQQAFYAVGTLLQAKLPEDKEMEAAYNKCAKLLGEMVAELMGDDEDDDDDLDDEDDDEDDEDDDKKKRGEKKSRRTSKGKPEKAEEPEAPSKPNSDPSDEEIG